MDNKDEILSLIDKITNLKKEKEEAVSNQTYENAANIREEETILLSKLDEVSGVDGFYGKVYTTEKILKLIESIINSTRELEKIRKIDEVFGDVLWDRYLVKLYEQRDEAYEAVLQLRSKIN